MTSTEVPGIDPSAGTPPAASPAGAPPLPDDLGVCHRMILELIETLQHSEHAREGLQQRIDLLLRRFYGPKAERFDPNQPWLIADMANQAAMTPAAEAVAEPTDGAEGAAAERGKRPGHGRQKLPEDLHRQRVEHSLPEAQRLCPHCGELCAPFGEEISEQLDYR